jgi:hypothetical protein
LALCHLFLAPVPITHRCRCSDSALTAPHGFIFESFAAQGIPATAPLFHSFYQKKQILIKTNKQSVHGKQMLEHWTSCKKIAQLLVFYCAMRVGTGRSAPWACPGPGPGPGQDKT